MADLKYKTLEPSEERRLLKLRIKRLILAKKEKELALEDIKVDIRTCKERLSKLGDFP